jgi:hypothetical protein
MRNTAVRPYIAVQLYFELESKLARPLLYEPLKAGMRNETARRVARSETSSKRKPATTDSSINSITNSSIKLNTENEKK